MFGMKPSNTSIAGGAVMNISTMKQPEMTAIKSVMKYSKYLRHG